MTTPRPTYRLVLRPEPDVAEPDRALRQLLKLALRTCRLRCIEAVEIPHQDEGGS